MQMRLHLLPVFPAPETTLLQPHPGPPPTPTPKTKYKLPISFKHVLKTRVFIVQSDFSPQDLTTPTEIGPLTKPTGKSPAQSSGLPSSSALPDAPSQGKPPSRRRLVARPEVRPGRLRPTAGPHGTTLCTPSLVPPSGRQVPGARLPARGRGLHTALPACREHLPPGRALRDAKGSGHLRVGLQQLAHRGSAHLQSLPRKGAACTLGGKPRRPSLTLGGSEPANRGSFLRKE